MEKKKISITETPNELTNDIDISSVDGKIRILRQSDAQIFFGWRDYPGLRDKTVLKSIERCVFETAKVLRNPNGKVVISGAGTSGRLAMFVSRKFNQLFKQHEQQPMFDYIMAGTNKALIKAQEGAEDDPILAVKDFENTVGGASSIAFYGVTCGFSAPYIAGQLDYTIQKQNIFSCLLGFNPLELSRTIAIENWNKTFFEVASAVDKCERAAILNPIVGPEPITGSTRMKGGSATKLLLELVFSLASIESGKIPSSAIAIADIKKNIPISEKIIKIIDSYEEAMKGTYSACEPLSKIVTAAGETLRSDGHIYYLGEAPFGILGLVDASECPPTFGADFGDVRGFIIGGWNAMLGEGKDISDIGLEYRISIDNFKKDIFPKLKTNDIVIGLGAKKIPNKILSLLKKAADKGVKIGALLINPAADIPEFIKFPVCVNIKNPSIIKDDTSFAEYALKLMLNAITTAAHILDGKIYQNRMIDLRISNNKLFYRSIGIISKIMGVSEDAARDSILKSLYDSENITDEQRNAPISQHVAAATPKSKIIPKALLLSTGKFNLAEASKRIEQEPIIRKLIEQMAAEK